MARQCPQCQTKIPAGWVAAFTDGMECPQCKAYLEVSAASRYIATTAGLLAAAGVAWWMGEPDSRKLLGWAEPVLYPFLALSAVSPLVLLLAADLVMREPEPARAAAETHGGHRGSHP